jgi:hypothetical protein
MPGGRDVDHAGCIVQGGPLVKRDGATARRRNRNDDDARLREHVPVRSDRDVL